MLRTTNFFLLLASTFLLPAQSIDYYPEAIEADGQLDEAVWTQIEPFKGFYNFFPIDEGMASMDTEVRIFHDDHFLNIAFVYHDTISAVRVNSRKRDNYGAGFHLSDCVGVIIDPYRNQQRGYFFAVNGEGAQLDALIANYDEENLSWDAIWESGISIHGTNKVYEMRIPLQTFSYDEQAEQWNIQFYTRDAKDRMYTVWNKFQRGFLQFDTRFLRPIDVPQIRPSKEARTMLIPALTATHRQEIESQESNQTLQASLDAQYKISDGLRLDATLNPDFSQVDVDQQVTNLSRFNIAFPERRNFFVENSDLFTTLGAASDINPFFFRFIGADQDILLGLKLSGNASANTRLGLLNVQSKKDDNETAQNYTVAVAKRQFGTILNTTGYLVNRQSISADRPKDYNRIAGAKINYLSNDRKWSGFATYSHSFSDEVDGVSDVLALSNNYNTRTLAFSTTYNRVGRNYLTDIGFVPRLNNYDALNEEVIRQGYAQFSQSVRYNYYPKDQSVVQTFRLVNASVNAYFDEDGEVFETNYFYNTAVFFANQMSVYVNTYHDDIALQFAFDPLRNGSLILPGNYRNTAVRVGFNSDYTQAIYGSVNAQLGSFYGGDRQRLGLRMGYRWLPLLNVELNYEYNTLELAEKGQQALHLFGLTTEVFFSNKLNWTTYWQYNEQRDNFNINSRLQWEYKPLSFVYLVFSNNHNAAWEHQDWGVSLKINRRLMVGGKG